MYIPSMLIEIELATESPLLKLLSITERWSTLLNMMKQLSYCRSSVKSSHHARGQIPFAAIKRELYLQLIITSADEW